MKRHRLFVLAFNLALLLFAYESPAAQLRLFWSDNSDNEEGFEIERMSPGSAFVTVAILGANASSYTDFTPAAGATYCYRIRAFNAEAISDYSNLGCAITPAMLSVSRFGSGAGIVTSNPAGIFCGNDCVEPYPRGSVVSLTSSPAEGSVFVGWNGAICSGPGDCIFNLERDFSVTAVFELVNPVPPPDPPPPSNPPSSPSLSLAGIHLDLASPQLVGTPVSFRVSATGGASPIEFKWWVFDGFAWRVTREWDIYDTFVFNPATPGAYVVGVWARQRGNANDRPENDAVLARSFTMMPRFCSSGQYFAEFFNNSVLTGNPVLTSCDDKIGYSWFAASSDLGLSNDNFSARWTGRFAFDGGFHNFVATADDGIRVRVDGNLIIDGWIDQSATTYQAVLELSAGEHEVQVDYYQNGGDALTQLYWYKAVLGNDDYYVMFERERLTVDAPGVLGNDNNFGANPLVANLVSGTLNGALVLNPDGSFNYIPNGNFNGTDSFTYRADSGEIQGDVITVSISVTPVNDTPLASNDTYVSMAHNILTVGAPGVLENDNDPDGDQLSAVLVSTTNHGTLNFNADGSFTYEPYPNFTGTDTFTYVVNDSTADSNLAMVTITVAAFNEVPVAHNDSYETIAIAGLVLTATAPGILANDTGANNQTLTPVIVTEPLFGTLTLNQDGSFEYAPLVNFSGTDSFSYRVSDGSADSNVAMVTIVVNSTTSP
jgi:hypothetical protein